MILFDEVLSEGIWARMPMNKHINVECEPKKRKKETDRNRYIKKSKVKKRNEKECS